MERSPLHAGARDGEVQQQHLHPPEPSHVDKPPTVYTLTPEELRVLRECNRESLLFRCIPFATILSSVAYYATKKGHLTPSPRFGVVPKVAGAAFVGYLLGKFSYQSICVEKILKLPNSKLADSVRKKRGITLPSESFGMESNLSNSDMEDVFSSIPQKPIFDDHKPDERDRVEGLDDYNRVTDSLSEYTVEPADASGPPVSTYDDRRRANRDEYTSKYAERHRRPLQQPEIAAPPAPSSASPYNTVPPAVGRRNQYGDIIYDE